MGVLQPVVVAFLNSGRIRNGERLVLREIWRKLWRREPVEIDLDGSVEHVLSRIRACARIPVYVGVRRVVISMPDPGGSQFIARVISPSRSSGWQRSLHAEVVEIGGRTTIVGWLSVGRFARGFTRLWFGGLAFYDVILLTATAVMLVQEEWAQARTLALVSLVPWWFAAGGLGIASMGLRWSGEEEERLFDWLRSQ